MVTGEKIKKMRLCNNCKTYKKEDEFYKNASRKDGLSSICSICSKEFTYKWRENNKEKFKEASKKYTKTYKNKIKEGVFMTRTETGINNTIKLCEFIIKNRRLPNTLGNNDEVVLYRFRQRSINKMKMKDCKTLLRAELKVAQKYNLGGIFYKNFDVSEFLPTEKPEEKPEEKLEKQITFNDIVVPFNDIVSVEEVTESKTDKETIDAVNFVTEPVVPLQDRINQKVSEIESKIKDGLKADIDKIKNDIDQIKFTIKSLTEIVEVFKRWMA